jgi:hypothetical protein
MSCHDSHSSNRVMRWPLGVGLLAASAGSTAQSALDLIIHNGFEACWSTAITKPQLRDLLKSTIDGRTGCILYAGYAAAGLNWEICNTQACAGGVGGCPVTFHAGTFTGDFGAGDFTASFSSPGTTDDISIPVSYYNDVISDTCTLTLSNLTQTYSPFVYFQPDGNGGDYIIAMNPLAITFDTVTPSSADPMCVSQAATAISYAQSIAGIEANVPLSYAVPGQSVCPLTP